ncbi:hypothetical protein ACJ72_00811 [Emergomyces africanus]|uniref:Uncharacterized protein n=1 Tax=Emergomyces africanus TaxID=1955775 RepID=A0A1B7P751_9EURO|nr:hypothetical protein ACJ72_00811 [Emergomyces africanus]
MPASLAKLRDRQTRTVPMLSLSSHFDDLYDNGDGYVAWGEVDDGGNDLVAGTPMAPRDDPPPNNDSDGTGPPAVENTVIPESSPG